MFLLKEMQIEIGVLYLVITKVEELRRGGGDEEKNKEGIWDQPSAHTRTLTVKMYRFRVKDATPRGRGGACPAPTTARKGPQSPQPKGCGHQSRGSLGNPRLQ